MTNDAMSADVLDPAAFDQAGRRAAGELPKPAAPKLRPALLAGYSDLPTLRYDYPLVLVRGEVGEAIVHSLSGIVDRVLQEIAPHGIEGERLRKHVLGLEKEIRVLVSEGAKEPLTRLWELAEANLLSRTNAAAQSALKDSLTRARAVLTVDGNVIDCDAGTAVELLAHLWGAVQSDRARRFLDKVNRLILGLSDVLKVDFIKSAHGRAPDRLKHSIGTAFEPAFDFEAMSQVLGATSRDKPLPAKQRQRIDAALSILKSQKFFAPTSGHTQEARPEQPYCFVFDGCAQALDAFQDRLPEMAALVKAITIAELELENRYRESAHDPFFDRFDENSLTPDDLALFPSYLVCVRNGDYSASEQTTLVEALSSGLPIKVLVQSDDILEDLPVSAGKFAFGRKGSQLANMAVGLNSAYVLQSSSSHLYQARDGILRGLTYDGPALFSVFSGCCMSTPDISPYLMAAAAMESRAFPAFTYDPAAGRDLASRFCISNNPQAEIEWPVHRLGYEDRDHQTITESVGFTFADFAACDSRYARCFARVPQSKWHDGMMPVAEYLALPTAASTAKSAYVSLVDAGNVLQRLVVDDELTVAVRRCADMWHRLQELGGINNSHAQRLLDRERELWEQDKERELGALRDRPEPEAKQPDAEQDTGARVETPPEGPEEAVEASADEPSIETPRCTTCDECTQINSRMFAYDENKQAYIADVDAGTYRELVEAAESCQVCIIHPGKPRNPNEPNLDELTKRAEPFR
jgi:hypothetical protein